MTLRRKDRRRSALVAEQLAEHRDRLAELGIEITDDDLNMFRAGPDEPSDEAAWLEAVASAEQLLATLQSPSTLVIERPGGDRTTIELSVLGGVVDGASNEYPDMLESAHSRYFDGPFSAEPPSGPAQPPAHLINMVPGLTEALSAGDPPIPAIRDFSWRADEPRSESGRMSHWPDWMDDDTALVEGAWTGRPWDVLVRDAIEVWTWQWPEVVAQTIPLRFPDAVDALASAHDSDARFARKREAHRHDWIDAALQLGLCEVYRRRVSWPSPVAQACAVCGRTFPPETLSHWMRRFGTPRYCQVCIVRVVNAHGIGHAPTQEYVIDAVKTVHAALGFVPPQDIGRSIDLSALEVSSRDVVVAALLCLPAASICADVLDVAAGRGRWLGVLEAAGVVSGGWRPSRGVMCFAEDGHYCRSLGEKSVDDWFARNAIAHECEPAWPSNADLNRNDLKRADWLLADGTYVEYAGMMADTKYAARIAEKVELARHSGLRLLVITPEDLPTLDTLLRRWTTS